MQNDSMLGHGDVAMGEAPQPHPQPQASGGKANLVVDARALAGKGPSEHNMRQLELQRANR